MGYKENHPHNEAKRQLQRETLYKIMGNPHRVKPYVAVCMPGRRCWDIDYLSKYDYRDTTDCCVGVQKIIAIEKDPEIAELIKEHCKDNDLVEVFCMTTTEFFNTYEGVVDLIYLDYYSSFTPSVMQDLEIILDRGVCEEKGKVVVNLFGAREPKTNQIRQQRLFKYLTLMLDVEDETWDDAEVERRRCVAFNGFLYKLTTIRTLNNGFYPSISIPFWRMYKNLSGYSMLTVSFTFKGYRKKKTYYQGRKSPDQWLVRGGWHIREKVKPTRFKIPYSELKERVREFYEHNHYTPQPQDFGLTSCKRLKEAIEDVGLCPRTMRTQEQIDAEILRISERDGYVTLYSIHKARLPTKQALISKYKGICERLGVKHRMDLQEVNRAIYRHGVVKHYLMHLENGGDLKSYPKKEKEKLRKVMLIKGRWSFSSLTPDAYTRDLEKYERFLFSRGLDLEGQPVDPITDEKLIDLYNQGIPAGVLASLCAIPKYQMYQRINALR